MVSFLAGGAFNAVWRACPAYTKKVREESGEEESGQKKGLRKGGISAQRGGEVKNSLMISS